MVNDISFLFKGQTGATLSKFLSKFNASDDDLTADVLGESYDVEEITLRKSLFAAYQTLKQVSCPCLLAFRLHLSYAKF